MGCNTAPLLTDSESSPDGQARKHSGMRALHLPPPDKQQKLDGSGATRNQQPGLRSAQPPERSAPGRSKLGTSKVQYRSKFRGGVHSGREYQTATRSEELKVRQHF